MTTVPSRRPPAHVPVLTEVVRSRTDVRREGMDGHALDGEKLEDQIIHRVMQRVDVVLEREIARAVARVIDEHTAQLAPRLREEVELAVRLAVMGAVSAELDRPLPGR